MQKFLLFTTVILFIILTRVTAQHIEWAKSISSGPVFCDYSKNDDKMYMMNFSYNSLKIDNVDYGYQYKPFLLNFNKNGSIGAIFPLMDGYIPNNFICGSSGFYFTGTSVGRTSFSMTKNTLTGNKDWGYFYTSKAPYYQHTPYYPEDEGFAIAEYKNSLYVTGKYQDSLILDNQYLYGSKSLFAKFEPTTGHLRNVRNIPGQVGNKLVNLNDKTFYIATDILTASNFDAISASPGTVISRIDTLENFSMAKTISNRTTVSSLGADNAKNIYLAAAFVDSCKIGNGSYIGKYGGIFLLKTDSSGNTIWSKVIHMQSGEYSNFSSVAVDSKNSSYVTGWFSGATLNLADATLVRSGSGTNAFLLKFDSNGKLIYSMNYGSNSRGYYLAFDNIGGVYWSGVFTNTMNVNNQTLTASSTNQDYGFLIKISNDLATSINTKTDKPKPLFNIYPNPNHGTFSLGSFNFSSPKVDLKIFDSLGRLILVKKINTELKEETFQLDDKGLYFLSIENENTRITEKLVVE
jgi:hypothetical protein